MPELPEVETMALGLRKDLLGRSLERVKIFEKGVLRETSPRALRALSGARVVGLSRRGKFLLLHFSNGAVILFHLKMTGRLVLQDRTRRRGPWERLQLEFEGWDRKLSFVDPRKFGYLAAITDEGDAPVPLMNELGPDALQVTPVTLQEMLTESRRPVKALLLDQRVIAGLGNIYVDECLHRAGIHPASPSSEISEESIAGLHQAIREVLRCAIECGGSTVRTFQDSRGTAGTYQVHHRVYGKKGERCRSCGSAIEYTRVASRGTHYCPSCQKKTRSGRKRRKKT